MKIEEIKLNYDGLRPNLSLLETEANFIINKEIDRKQMKTHTIKSRIKTFESFFKKVSDKAINEPFEEVTDLLGLRVVCLFRSYIDKIGSLIRDSFIIINEDNMIEGY